MKCENCGIEHDGIYGSGRFCSEKCARGFTTKFNRDEISRKVSLTLGGKGILKEKNCLYCGALLTKKNAKKFCCNAHQQQFQRDKTWSRADRDGVWYTESCNSVSRGAKNYLIARRGYRCEICGITEWKQGPIPLVLDHIDGESDNWSLNNIRLVCRNCDGELPTFCGRNQKNGHQSKRQKYRNERYHKGLSH